MTNIYCTYLTRKMPVFLGENERAIFLIILFYFSERGVATVRLPYTILSVVFLNYMKIKQICKHLQTSKRSESLKNIRSFVKFALL